MYNIFFFLIITIIVFGHASGLYLDFLNNKMWSDTVPDKLKGIIDKEKYKTSQNYYKTNKNFSNISSSFFLFIILAMLFLGGFAWIDSLGRAQTEYL